MVNEKLVLAPLAGYTDKAFREIASLFGAEASVTEMVSAEGLARDSLKTEELLERYQGEEKLIVQLFGSTSDPFKRSVKNLLKYNPSEIDINAGCPVNKVVKTGSGSALMRNPQLIYDIVRTLKEETGLPISVKFRLGWDEKSINYLEFATLAYKAGASSLTLHARTRSQGYAGSANREAFKALKENFKGENVKLYASGDIFTPEDALSLLKDYQMDGVMFARGAIGNPFIFRETKELIEKNKYTLPSINEKVETAIHHYSLMEKYYGEKLASKEMRKHIMAYIKGIKGSKEVKDLISKANNKDEYIVALNHLLM